MYSFEHLSNSISQQFHNKFLNPRFFAWSILDLRWDLTRRRQMILTEECQEKAFLYENQYSKWDTSLHARGSYMHTKYNFCYSFHLISENLLCFIIDFCYSYLYYQGSQTNFKQENVKYSSWFWSFSSRFNQQPLDTP